MSLDRTGATARTATIAIAPALIDINRAPERTTRLPQPTIPSDAPSPHAATPLHVLPAVDVQLGAGDVARLLRTEIIDRLGNLFRLAETAQRNRLDDLFRSRREDRGVDLARRNRIDANAERTKIRGHFAGQRCERRL